MFGFKSLNLYELDIERITYWTKVFYPETGRHVFKRIESEKDYLYLDKLGNPKSLPKTDGSYYFDLVSGRLFAIKEEGDNLIILPSNIVIAKDRLVKGKDILKRASDILLYCEEEYVSNSEDIIFNSYFCDIISQREGLEEVPVDLVMEEIEKNRIEYHKQKADSDSILRRKLK